MLRWLLTHHEMDDIVKMLVKGATPAAYNQIAGYLAGKGFGWATASGAVRRMFPSFVPLTFAKHWLRPYKAHRQKVLMERLGTDIQIEEKHYVEHGLKESTKYMYTAQCDLLDEDGFIYSTRHFSYYSDNKYTPEEAVHAAESVFQEQYGEDVFGASNFQFVNAFHNEGWSY